MIQSLLNIWEGDKIKRLLSPELLRKLIQHDRLIKKAILMLKGDWESLFNGQLIPPQIDAPVIITAKQLNRTKLFSSVIDFSSYSSVKRYLTQNDVYINSSAKRILLAPFKE